jgi:dTDP-glucose 4,6-dehydratase
MKVLVTGAAGFIGSHIVEGLLKETDWTIVGLDRLDETATLERISYTDAYRQNRSRFRYIWHDLRGAINPFTRRAIIEGGDLDAIWHLAASTHVDRSIADPLSFVADNVVGTANVLEFARHHHRARLIYFSTDEVFGPAPVRHTFDEWDRFKSSNPYAATKAAGEELTLSYVNTYGLDAIITHTVNVFGERQHPEKFIPLVVRRLLLGDKIVIHADRTRTRPASRYWIHARNVLAALRFLHERGRADDKYNITSDHEVDCLTLAQEIAAALGRPLKYDMVDADTGRPGHDLRYSLDGRKLAAMGFVMPLSFDESLTKCVRWMAANPRWLGL